MGRRSGGYRPMVWNRLDCVDRCWDQGWCSPAQAPLLTWRLNKTSFPAPWLLNDVVTLKWYFVCWFTSFVVTTFPRYRDDRKNKICNYSICNIKIWNNEICNLLICYLFFLLCRIIRSTSVLYLRNKFFVFSIKIRKIRIINTENTENKYGI